MMSRVQPFRVSIIAVLMALVIGSGFVRAEDKIPGKVIFKDVYFPQLIDSGQKIAYFKIVEQDSSNASRFCIGDLNTGEETIYFKDINFNRDRLQAFCVTPDNKYVGVIDKHLTMCDIWLQELANQYAEPIRLTNLEQFDPGYTSDQVMALGMNPKDVLDVRQFDISPDGKKIAFTFGILGKTAVWMYEIDRDHYRQMTPDRQGFYPKWFPDSERFTYVKGDSISGKWSEDIFIMTAKTNESKPLVYTEKSEGWATPSPDGKYVAYLENTEGHWNPCVVRVSDGKTARILDLPTGKSCGSVIFNEDSSALFAVISGYKGALSYLVEIPFDPKVLD